VILLFVTSPKLLCRCTVCHRQGISQTLTAVLMLLLLGATCCLLAGVQDLYGTPSLGLCPSTPNCISTAEEANMSEDVNGGKSHYIPQWYASHGFTPALTVVTFHSHCKCTRQAATGLWLILQDLQPHSWTWPEQSCQPAAGHG